MLRVAASARGMPSDPRARGTTPHPTLTVRDLPARAMAQARWRAESIQRHTQCGSSPLPMSRLRLAECGVRDGERALRLGSGSGAQPYSDPPQMDKQLCELESHAPAHGSSPAPQKEPAPNRKTQIFFVVSHLWSNEHAVPTTAHAAPSGCSLLQTRFNPSGEPQTSGASQSSAYAHAPINF